MHHVGVGQVDPVLIKCVGAGTVPRIGREPDCLTRRLAHLRAVGAGHERRRDPVRLAGLGGAVVASDEVDAGNDVAVLIGAGHLDRAVGGAVEVKKIIRLEDHVAELGVADPLLPLLKPPPH